jgi:probable rRNA maturation factor
VIVRDPGLPFLPGFPLGRVELARLCSLLLEALGLRGCRFDLRLVDDAGMAALNRKARGFPGPTNVLSFPSGEEPRKGAFLGDLVLSVETLAREAHLYGQEPTEHTARLLAHGLLHLAGLEHGETMDALTETAVEAAAGAFGRAFAQIP